VVTWRQGQHFRWQQKQSLDPVLIHQNPILTHQNPVLDPILTHQNLSKIPNFYVLPPGPVGSGKSTLVLGLLGELTALSGHVSCGGRKALSGQETPGGAMGPGWFQMSH